MTYSTVPDKATGDVFTEAMWDTYLRDNLNKGVVRPIGETIVGAAPVASISFTGIAADWSHLRLEMALRGDTVAANLASYIRFNGDSGNNYDAQALYGNGAVAAAVERFAQAQISDEGQIPGASASASRFSHHVIDILNYADSNKMKAIVATIGRVRGTGAGDYTHLTLAGLWRSTAPITQITILPASGNFVQFSHATLYGKGGI